MNLKWNGDICAMASRADFQLGSRLVGFDERLTGMGVIDDHKPVLRR